MNYFHFRALSGRSNASLSNIIMFIIRYISDQRFSRVLIDVANTLLTAYEDKIKEFTGDIGRSFINLSKALRKEEKITKEFLEVQGALELIMAGASITDRANDTATSIRKTPKKFSELNPSENARKELIIDVN